MHVPQNSLSLPQVIAHAPGESGKNGDQHLPMAEARPRQHVGGGTRELCLVDLDDNIQMVAQAVAMEDAFLCIEQWLMRGELTEAGNHLFSGHLGEGWALCSEIEVLQCARDLDDVGVTIEEGMGQHGPRSGNACQPDELRRADQRFQYLGRWEGAGLGWQVNAWHIAL